jgi:hypothetical protein
MSVGQFRFHHPQAYRRLLAAGCLGMLVCGLGSTVVSHLTLHQSTDWTALDELIQPASAAPSPVPVVLTSQELPGQDGSITQAQAQAAAAAAVATPATVVADALTNGGDIQSLGRTMNAAMFGDQYWEALDQLWTRESNWRPTALNRSGACGIPQALPCSKIPDHSPQGQISWGLQYIQQRYGNPANAWAHEERYGWY